MAENARNFTFRVRESWIETLEKLTQGLGLDPSRDRSRVLRELVERESNFWELSPYVSESTRVFIFISESGTKLYWGYQNLFLNANCEELQTAIALKPEWKENVESPDDRAEVIRDARERWLINYFGAWAGAKPGKQLIVHTTDRTGAIVKYAALPANQQQGARLVREILAAYRGYVAPYRPGTVAHDRTDVPVQIPTLEIEIHLIVDVRFYSNLIQRKSVALSYHLSNLDRKEFPTVQLPEITWVHGRYPLPRNARKAMTQAVAAVSDSMSNLRARILDIAGDTVSAPDGKPFAEAPAQRDELRAIELPEEYLFGLLRWRFPNPSVLISMTWNRPEPVTTGTT